MRAIWLVIAIVLSNNIESFSQEIQWASEVVFQYNQYSENEYSGNEVLGKPDAEPYGQISTNAYKLNAESSYGTIKLGFANPQHVSQVVIVENFLPGQVCKVILHDSEENSHIIYEGAGKKTNQPFNVLTLKIDKTPYQVQIVEVHLNTYVNKGWSQIDAIGVCDNENTKVILPGATPTNTTPSYASTTITPTTGNTTFISQKENLSENVNSKYMESKPIISADGLTLYFARKNCPSNTGGRRDEQDIYISELVGNEWSVARNADQPLNDKLPNGICSVSPDGNTIMVINGYTEKGRVEYGVSAIRKTKSGWSNPKKQIIENYYNLSEFQDYFQSNSGKVLISSVQRNDSKGEQDLYISFRTDKNSWSKPKNMGEEINSIGVEFAPFLASDNRTLYFASNGHPGLGESDIFYSKRLDDTWTKWSTPKNIGESINSESWDGYYTLSAKGDYAYFISTSGAKKKAELTATDEDIYRISLSNEAKPDPVVLVKGKVINSITKEPIEADIYYESLPLKTEDGIAISNPTNGEYKIVLPAGNKYEFHAQAKGYISVGQHEDFSDVDEYKEITRDLLLTPINAGESVP